MKFANIPNTHYNFLKIIYTGKIQLLDYYQISLFKMLVIFHLCHHIWSFVSLFYIILHLTAKKKKTFSYFSMHFLSPKSWGAKRQVLVLQWSRHFSNLNFDTSGTVLRCKLDAGNHNNLNELKLLHRAGLWITMKILA